MEISNLFSCPSSFFLEKKEIRKRQGKYKRGISERSNMDPDHVISGMGITGSNRESIYCLLHLRCGISSFYIYLYYIVSLYDANIQYVQLLSWSILVVHIYYPVLFILGYSNNPALSDLTSFYWSTLIEQNFIISPLFFMALSFILGSLYWTSIIMIRILYLGYSNNPALSDLTSFYWSTLIEQNFIISPLFFMALSFILGSLYWTSIIMIRILYLGYSTIHVIFLIQFSFWSILLTHVLIYYLYSWADLLDQFYYWFTLSSQYLFRSIQFLDLYTSPYFFYFWFSLLYQSHYTGLL